ncbi:unnamed protein product [Linum trigynum]|uniref:Uncharacterized protein n=1 Tax=Linum trigynum TaxID=586398 RepID=A0AAV2CF41_9ROSI
MNHTYTVILNKFADLTNDEYHSKYLRVRLDQGKPLRESRPSDRYAPRVGESLPDSIDWRTKGVVAEVKDQGGCGKSEVSDPSFSLLFCLNQSPSVSSYLDRFELNWTIDLKSQPPSILVATTS